MYWSDAGSTAPKIERAWMNGDKRETLVSTHLTRPASIAIDFYMGDRVYWSDSKENRIESMRPDGTDRVVVLAKGGETCLVFKNKVYSCLRRETCLVFENKVYSCLHHSVFIMESS